jgi:hypothetical protein
MQKKSFLIPSIAWQAGAALMSLPRLSLVRAIMCPGLLPDYCMPQAYSGISIGVNLP